MLEGRNSMTAWMAGLTAVGLALTLLAGPPATAQAAAGADSAADGQDGGDDLWDYLGSRPMRLTASTGIDYTSGDYGSGAKSKVLYVPTAVKLELEPLVFKLTVPWLRVDGDVVLIGDQPIPVPVSGGSRSGVGDVVLSAGYVYYPKNDFLPLTEFTTKFKFGTADETRGLGTGETDYTLQLDLSKGFGPLTPFVTGGYRFVGSPPGFDLRNKAFATAGLTVRLSRQVFLGAAYDWSQSSARGRGDAHELSPFATFKLGRHVAIDPYAVVGLSTNSPDWGGGLQLRLIYDN
jgi:hypothetical protein